MNSFFPDTAMLSSFFMLFPQTEQIRQLPVVLAFSVTFLTETFLLQGRSYSKGLSGTTLWQMEYFMP